MILAREMFSSGCRPRLKNARALSSLFPHIFFLGCFLGDFGIYLGINEFYCEAFNFQLIYPELHKASYYFAKEENER